MTAAARILVAGGSLGGLLAANVLWRAGHDVTVLEKASGLQDGRGAGLVTHSGLFVALRAAGAVIDETLGVRVATRVVMDASGEVAARGRYAQLLTSWSRLYALLLEALPAERYRSGMAVAHIEQDAAGVRVACTSGERLQADLLIASDGIRSAVRAQFAPQAVAQYAGYTAWRGVCDEALLSPHTLATLFDNFGLGLPRGEQMIGYPVAGQGNQTQRGARRYNFVWYRPADEAVGLRRLMTDDEGQHHAGGIAPNKISAREIAAMRQAGRALLAPQFAEVLEKTAQPFLQPIYDVVSERIAFGRVALMGDASFVARPHVGMGVTKAGEDALALVAAIARHGATPAALQAYEAQRLAAGQAVVERSRRLGAYMQAQGGSAAERGAAESRRDAFTVLSETAIDLALGTEPEALAA